MNRMFQPRLRIVAMNRCASKWVNLQLKHSSVQCVARRRVYVSMLSSSHRFVSGDLPLTKWLRSCGRVGQEEVWMPWNDAHSCLFNPWEQQLIMWSCSLNLRQQAWKGLLGNYVRCPMSWLLNWLCQWFLNHRLNMKCLRRMVALKTWGPWNNRL